MYYTHIPFSISAIVCIRYKTYITAEPAKGLGNSPIIGKEQVLEVSKMSQLESFPVITIKNVVAEGSCVVIESIGKVKTKNGKP